MSKLSRATIRRRTTLTALLLIAAAIGILAIAATDPALVDSLHHPRDDVFLVTGFLVVAMFGGALLFPLYFEPTDDDTTDYEPEATPKVPYAGTDVEPLTRHPLVASRVTDDERAAIRERLREATITMIHRRTGVSTDEASARVRRGDWTENAAAAWFLGESPPPRSVRAYARISDGLAFRHGARETVREVVAYGQRHTEARGETA